MIHQLHLSCDTFGGFSVQCTPLPADSLNTLVERVLKKLDETLAHHHLDMLRDQLRTYRAQKQYHIHTHAIEQILYATHPLQIYICRCSSEAK